jgi:hypothetical protein
MKLYQGSSYGKLFHKAEAEGKRPNGNNINKLQRVQNMATRLFINTHMIPSQLHWLPISKCTDFKIPALTYKLLNTQQPTYHGSFVQFHTLAYQTQSSELYKLHTQDASRSNK